MGRNSLSATQLAHKIIASLNSLSEMLSPKYRKIMKRFSEYILQHRVSIHNATDHLPMLAALLIIQLEEHERNNHEFNELYRQIEELRLEVRTLKPAE